MRRFFALLTVVVFLSSGRGLADDVSPAVKFVHPLSGDPEQFQIYVDVQQALASPLGQWLVASAAREDPRLPEKIRSFGRAAGLDPLTEIHEVLIWGDLPAVADAVNGPEEGGLALPQLVARLGAQPGNVEGWLLAAPGYASQDLDARTTLHSFLVPPEALGDLVSAEADAQEPLRLWCAVPRIERDGCYVLVAAFQPEQVVQLAALLRSEGIRRLRGPYQGGDLLAVTINKAPQWDLPADQSGAALLQTLKRLHMVLSSRSDEAEVQLVMEAVSPARARQMRQLLAGAAAAVSLALEESPDEQAQRSAVTLREALTIRSAEESPFLEASLRVEHDLLTAILEGSQANKQNNKQNAVAP